MANKKIAIIGIILIIIGLIGTFYGLSLLVQTPTIKAIIFTAVGLILVVLGFFFYTNNKG
ncbi:MAG: hypothetical protein QXG00_01465 [Candidatus Woesearchaeota archaeon]